MSRRLWDKTQSRVSKNVLFKTKNFGDVWVSICLKTITCQKKVQRSLFLDCKHWRCSPKTTLKPRGQPAKQHCLLYIFRSWSKEVLFMEIRQKNGAALSFLSSYILFFCQSILSNFAVSCIFATKHIYRIYLRRFAIHLMNNNVEEGAISLYIF